MTYNVCCMSVTTHIALDELYASSASINKDQGVNRSDIDLSKLVPIGASNSSETLDPPYNFEAPTDQLSKIDGTPIASLDY